MKKILLVLFALMMCFQMAACFAEGNEEAAGALMGVPNPVVEYSSLEEINKLIGVELIRPEGEEVSNERFSVIDGKIAQVDCEIRGLEWTFRAAYITDEDISGMYNENNVFDPNQDFTLYVNEFYLDRFFDGDRQYTIVVMEPISPDGDLYLDSVAFSDICMSCELIQKGHMNDPAVGDYQGTDNRNVNAYVERSGDVYNIQVFLYQSETETTTWTMYDAVKEGDRLNYGGEEIARYVYDVEGNELSGDVTATNNIGYFELKDGKLIWTGAGQEELRGSVFEKIVYEAE